jgi:excisionase family DNA binding protein
MVDISKEVFTTGEAAKIMKVSQQTVIRCFDNGTLEGFRVPGSKFRRIPRNILYSFMKDNGIPTDAFEQSGQRVLFWGDGFDSLGKRLTEEKIDVQINRGDIMQLGWAVDKFRPQLLVIMDEVFDPDTLSSVCSNLQSGDLGFSSHVAILRKKGAKKTAAEESGLLTGIATGRSAAETILKLLTEN